MTAAVICFNHCREHLALDFSGVEKGSHDGKCRVNVVFKAQRELAVFKEILHSTTSTHSDHSFMNKHRLPNTINQSKHIFPPEDHSIPPVNSRYLFATPCAEAEIGLSQ